MTGMLQLPISHRWSGAPAQPFSDGWKEHGLRLFVRNTFIDVEDTFASEVSRSDASRRGSRSCAARFCGETPRRLCTEDQSPTAAKKRAAAAAAKERDLYLAGSTSGTASADTGDGDFRDETETNPPSEDTEDQDSASSATEPWAEDDREEWTEAGSTAEDPALRPQLSFDQTPTAFPTTQHSATPLPGVLAFSPETAMGFCWSQSTDGWYSMPAVSPGFPASYEYTEYAAVAPVVQQAAVQQVLPAPPTYFAPFFLQQEDDAAPPPADAPSALVATQEEAVVQEAPEVASVASPASQLSPQEIEAEEEKSSEEPDAQLPSEGSRLHGVIGEDSQPVCQPCAWFYKTSGCKNGRACYYCHLCPKEELKTRKKDKVMRLRAQQQ
jgi:hypothetical protein